MPPTVSVRAMKLAYAIVQMTVDRVDVQVCRPLSISQH